MMADKADTRERWLPVVGYETKFEVSDLGRVRRVDRTGAGGRVIKGHMCKLSLGDAGYLRVNVDHGKTLNVHEMVLRAFVGPKPFESAVALHANDNPLDNRLSNLSWGSHRRNALDAIRNGIDLAPRHADGGGVNALKKYCVHGHEFTPENTGIRSRSSGGRYCKQCAKIRQQRRKGRVAMLMKLYKAA